MRVDLSPIYAMGLRGITQPAGPDCISKGPAMHTGGSLTGSAGTGILTHLPFTEVSVGRLRHKFSITQPRVLLVFFTLEDE